MTRAIVPRRGPGRPGYDLESLLAVAVGVFNERGYDGTSMEDLSQRLGISKSAIYHHVDSKEALLSLALDRALDGLFEVAAEVRHTDAPAIDRLEQLVRGSIEVLVQRLPYVTLLLRVRGNTEVERRAMARRRQFDRVVAALVDSGRGGWRRTTRRRPRGHGKAAVRSGELVGGVVSPSKRFRFRRYRRGRVRDCVRRSSGSTKRSSSMREVAGADTGRRHLRVA